MEEFHIDIIGLFCELLSDYDKLRFLSVSTMMHKYKGLITFTNIIYLDKIKNLWYFDQFRAISVGKFDGKLHLPEKATYLRFDSFYDKSLMYYDETTGSLQRCIPDHIKCLHFDDCFNQALTYGPDDQSMIPPNVEGIYFGSYFNQPINNVIPPNTKVIFFGSQFNQPINGCIPNGIITLRFGYSFNQDISDLPVSLVCLVLSYDFKRYTNLEHLVNLKLVYVPNSFNINIIKVGPNCSIECFGF